MAMTTAERAQGPKPGSAEAERERQVRQAEELLFSGPPRSGFAKAPVPGRVPRRRRSSPIPSCPPTSSAEVDEAVADVRRFADAEHRRRRHRPRGRHPPQRDRRAGGARRARDDGADGVRRPRVHAVGLLPDHGGHRRALLVDGRVRQRPPLDRHPRACCSSARPSRRRAGCPPLARGEKLAAFALTETEAGSDASQRPDDRHARATTARPIVLNGTKRYITNGAIADVLTVMARTPDPKGGESKVTAFLVTPDMPGFEVVEARMEKCGIRGTATARLAFHDMPVPAANMLGPLGKGLKVALTVLDFGRTTFGASCTGAAKACLAAADPPRRPPPAVRPPAGRPRADQEEARLPRRHGLRDGGDAPTRPPP